MLFELPEIESRYIRNTWMLSAHTLLEFLDSSKLRFFTADEADTLAEKIRKRNVFARHSRENNFYYQRAKGLANQTVIEVCCPGDPLAIRDKADAIAIQVERVAVLSSTLVLKKKDFLRKLGINTKPRAELNFAYSPDFQLISSTSKKTPNVEGLIVDKTFARRFAQCGLYTLTEYVQTSSDLANRVSLSLQWLFDSKTEPRIQSSVVKTSIALESLLIFLESESLAQSLSERAAFILSSDPSRRELISKILKRFYEVRSGVVHGSQKKAKKLTPALLETVDRLTLLLDLVISANSKNWTNTDSLRQWCENQRWGEPSKDTVIPFPDTYLKNALTVARNELV
jgi:hypothetical protein